MTPPDSEILAAILQEIQAGNQALLTINSRLGSLEARSHTPLDCPAILPLQIDVRRLTLHEARQGGMLAVVGVMAAVVASAISGVVLVIFSRYWR